MHGAVNVETEKWCMYVYAVSFPGCSSVWICEWCLVYMETCISCMGDVNSITTVYLHLLVFLHSTASLVLLALYYSINNTTR